jgi:lysophospholipase L1-like esterase
MRLRTVGLGLATVLLILAGLMLGARYFMRQAASAEFWESEIVAFEEADRANRPDTGAILFTGSSSIVFWSDLEEDMAPWYVLNRGFGGAHLDHVNTYLSRIVLPYQASAIVLYAGDNDIGAGKSAKQVADDFSRFVGRVRYSGSRAPIFFIAIKPSRMRFALWDEMTEANRLIAEQCRSDPALFFVDIATPMLALSPEGEPPPSDLFLFDGLHLSKKGYALWADVVRKAIEGALRELRSYDPQTHQRSSPSSPNP